MNISPPGRWGRWAGLLVLLGYALPTLYLFHGVIARLSHAIVGPWPDGDAFYNVWHLWVAKHALEAGQDPAFTDRIYALRPGQVQIFVEYLYSDWVGWLLQLVATPLAAYNLLIVSSFVLSGCTAYLLAREFLHDRLACFASGWLYTFSTYHFHRAAGHLGLATIQWLPFCAWRLIVLVRRPSLANALLAGVSVALVPLSDIYYVACFLVPFGLVLLVRTLLVEPRWFTARRHLLLATIAALLAVSIAGPPLASYLRMHPEMASTNRELVRTGLTAHSADLATYVLPNEGHRYFGRWTSPIYARMTGIETDAYLGGVPLLLGCLAVCFRQNRKSGALFWLVVAVTGVVFSLGPTVMVGGHVLGSSLVYRLIFGLPLLGQFRAPNRTSVLALLAMSVLTAYTIRALLRLLESHVSWRRLLRVALGAALGAALLDSSLRAALGGVLLDNSLRGVPYPSQPVSAPSLYQEISRDRDDVILLNLPLLLQGSHQYYQTIHQKRILFAVVSRLTPSMVSSTTAVPYLGLFWVTNMSTAQKIGFAKDWQVLGAQSGAAPDGRFKGELRKRHIRYVVLHRSTDPNSDAWMRSYLHASLDKPFYDDGREGLTAWRLDEVPARASGPAQ